MGGRAQRQRGGAPVTGAQAPNKLAALLEQGVRFHQSGNLSEASAVYQRVLLKIPDQPDALHLLGVVHHQSGDHQTAIDLIERSVRRNPKNVDAHSNLGAALSAAGNLESADRSFRKAIKLDPRHLSSHANLAALAVRRGADRDAIESFTKAHKLKPEEPRFIKRLAELYLKHEQFAEAADWFSRYLAFIPDDAEIHNNAALAYERSDRLQDAEKHYRRASELNPDKPEIANNLASVLKRLDRPEDAERIFDRVLELDPMQWEDLSHYAGALFNNGRLDKALALYETLTLERPGDANLHRDFASALMQAGRLEDAENACRWVLQINPAMDGTRIDLAHCLLHQRRIEEATAELLAVRSDSPHYLNACLDLCLVYAGSERISEACEVARRAAAHRDFRSSMFVKPYTVFRTACAFDDIEALKGSLADVEDRDLHTWAGVFLELLVDAETPERIQELADLHCRLGERLVRNAAANPLPEITLGARSDKIRLGFVSSDLRKHSVARFVLPLFENYDREKFEIYCYSPDEDRSDTIQNRMRSLVKEFRILGTRGHRDVAETIRSDEIDILFELNGFTADSRLPVMAYRPAPVQIYWLGYPFTCGLPTMDYILLDGDVAPAAGTNFLVEEPLLMPRSWVCYDAFEIATHIGDLPLDRNGCVTFGTLNNPYKFTRSTVALWAEVMRKVPGARCLLVHQEYDTPVIVENLTAEFKRHGIGQERLSFTNNRGGGLSHFDYYNEIDITLDSFPLTGGTTSCDALWMGVPIISRTGPSIHQRLSYSILCDVGLDDLCADTGEGFVEKAVALAGDTTRLRQLRQDLRGIMRESALGRADEFGRDFCDLMSDVAKRHALRESRPSEPVSDTHSANKLHVPLLHLR